jgi:hypothetical protein
MRDVFDTLCELGRYEELSVAAKHHKLLQNGQKQVGIHAAFVGLIDLEIFLSEQGACI